MGLLNHKFQVSSKMSKERTRSAESEFYLTVEEGKPEIKVKFGICLLIGLLVLAAGALYLLVVTFSDVKSSEDDEDVSENIFDKIIAKRFLDNINLKENPCKNFYQYTCGKYINNTVLPEGKEKWAVEDELEVKVEKQVRLVLGILNHDQRTLSRPSQQLIQFYKLCKDQDYKSTAKILLEIRDVLDEADVGLLLEVNSAQKQDIFQTENKLRRHGLFADSLLKISFNLNSSEANFKVGKPQLLLDGLGETVKDEYSKYVTSLLRLFGLNETKIEDTAKEVVEVEASLAKMAQTEGVQLPATNYTLTELKSLPSLSWLPWDQLLQSLLPASIPLNPLYTVAIDFPEYVTRLKDLANKHSESALVNYLFWRAFEDLIPWGSRELRAIYWHFRKLPEPPFFQRCLQQMSREMSVAISSLYVSRIFGNSSKTEAVNLVENARREIIAQNKPLTRVRDMSNVSNVEAHIAYPEEISNTALLEDFYKNLQIPQDGLVKAWLSLARWRRHSDISQHLSDKGSSHWTQFSDVFTPRATFNVDNQYIDINAGFLQPPVFSPKFPSYINYGSLGFLAAHHLVHALQETTEAPDYRGLSDAYQAYKRAVTSQEPVVPTLQHYSPDQLFMLSFANLFCTKYRNITPLPSPRESMVNLVVRNTPEFYSAFNCSKSP